MTWRDRDALLAHLAAGRAKLAEMRGWTAGREVDDCPAEEHRHSVRGWSVFGCRCPSTRKAWDRKLEHDRQAARLYRQRHGRPGHDTMAPVDLRKADRHDADLIAAGYRLPRASLHTRGLAVKIMRDRAPGLTDAQIADRLTNAGQGRMVSRGGQPPAYEPVSTRSVQRITFALAFKVLRSATRAGSRLDRSSRSR